VTYFFGCGEEEPFEALGIEQPREMTGKSPIDGS